MKIIKTVEVVVNLNEILEICNVYEFAINEGYRVSKADKELIKGFLEIDFIKDHKVCYPLLFEIDNIIN